MKSSQLLKTALVLATGLLLSTAASQAVTYHIDIDTSVLNLPVNSGNAPFSLDFQLNSGDTLNNNTAFITNFTFAGGGAPFGSANTINGASGGLPGSITLSDSGAFNEFYQSFTSGSTIGFDVSLTQNLDAGATPDGFAISILDGSLFNIPTSGFGDSLFFTSINTTGPLAVTLGSGTGTYSGVNITASVPDAGSTLVFLGLALLGVAYVSRKTAGLRQA